MKILTLQTLKGPNYWSIYSHHLIELRLDLEDLDTVFTNEISGFYDGLVELLPGLAGRQGEMGYPGEFLERVQAGILMPEVVKHVALELQTLSGMPVQFGQTCAAAIAGVYRVAVEYQDERTGRFAVRAAVDIVQSLSDRGTYPAQDLEQDLADLRQIGIEAPQQDSGVSDLAQATMSTITIIGRNYCTTTTRLLSHLFRYMGRTVRSTRSQQMSNFLQPQSCRRLADRSTQATVTSAIDVDILETSARDILRSGLAVKQVDVSVILEIPQTPLGCVNTLDDLMQGEGVVIEATLPQGCVVLNADEPLIVAMAQRANARIAYFSMNALSPVIWEHVRQGGLVAIYEDGYLSIIDGTHITRVEQVSHVPVTVHGLTPVLIKEALAALLVAYVQGVSIPNIRAALKTCAVTPEPASCLTSISNRWSEPWSINSRLLDQPCSQS